MTKRDPVVEIEISVQADTAASLGLAGCKLTQAVEAVAAFDRRGFRKGKERKALLHAAADALWALVVQREMIGLTDNRDLNHVFGVTPEMWGLMGIHWSRESLEGAPPNRALRPTPSLRSGSLVCFARSTPRRR